MEKLLNFDIHAMTVPKTRADVLALIEEGLSELHVINQALDEILASECIPTHSH